MNRRARASNDFMAIAPRFVVEAAGIVVIALIALVMASRPGGLVAAIPVLGALALGTQRLLPLLQQAYAGWSRSGAALDALADVVALARMPVAADPAPPRAPVRLCSSARSCSTRFRSATKRPASRSRK